MWRSVRAKVTAWFAQLIAPPVEPQTREVHHYLQGVGAITPSGTAYSVELLEPDHPEYAYSLQMLEEHDYPVAEGEFILRLVAPAEPTAPPVKVTYADVLRGGQK